MPRLQELRDQGLIADMALAGECTAAPNALRYNPALS